MRPYNDMLIRANANLQASNLPQAFKDAGNRALQEVVVEVSGRLTTSAGNASCRRLFKDVTNLKIKLSRSIFATIPESEKFDTVSHEFAHIVDYIIRQNSNHDRQWKAIHMACGGSANRCHNYEVTKRKVKRYILVKDGREYKVSTRRWNQDRYALLAHGFNLDRVEVYQGRQLVSSQKAA